MEQILRKSNNTLSPTLLGWPPSPKQMDIILEFHFHLYFKVIPGDGQGLLLALNSGDHKWGCSRLGHVKGQCLPFPDVSGPGISTNQPQPVTQTHSTGLPCPPSPRHPLVAAPRTAPQARSCQAGPRVQGDRNQEVWACPQNTGSGPALGELRRCWAHPPSGTPG